VARRLILAAALALAAPWPCRGATLVDPRLRFRVLTTAHFVLYFHQGEERLAARLAQIAEETWQRLEQPFGIRPPKRTHVVLADQTELSNGFATPMPYDTIFITAVWPAPTEFIGNTDEWLVLVFTHEFTHIVHLDRSLGWARVLRGVFGRAPYVFPNLLLPTWQVEGLATYEESVITGEGRLHAGDFRAVLDESARAGRLAPLDRVNGGLIDWPSGNAPYAYGVGFHAYLADRYGAETLAHLAEATAGRVPYTASPMFRRVYGRSLGELWKDYEASLSRAAVSESPSAPVTRITNDGFVAAGPRFVPPDCAGCPASLVYASRTPHAFPSLNIVALNGSAPRRLTRRYYGSTAAISGPIVYFDQQEVRRNVGVYSDLYALDRRSGSVTRLTTEARLVDPDLSPDGRTIACVRNAPGRRELVLVHLASGRASSIETLLSLPDTQFNAPRWSPDGTMIAVEEQSPGSPSRVAVYNLRLHGSSALAGGRAHRFATPAWRPDGRAVVVAEADGEGPFNLFEYPVNGGPPRQLTNLSGGATWPDVSNDGRRLAFVGYTIDGFDVFTAPYPPSVDEPSHVVSDIERPVDEPAVDPAPPSSPYKPWPTLAPTSWSPIVQSDNNGLRLGAAVSGYDVLQYHAWSASATWLAAPPAGAPQVQTSEPDWQVSYVYNRWRAVPFASASLQTSFFAAPPAANGAPSAGTVREHRIETGVTIPLIHVRVSHTAFASYFRSNDDFSSPAPIVSRTRAALRAGWSTSSAHEYGYSISPEDGISIGGTAEFVRSAIGADGDATTATADIRAYIGGFAAHHVLAVRAAGGQSTGDTLVRRVFLLGGPGPDVTPLDFCSGAISVLRGFPANTFAGSHVALANVDYRWPLAWPQRGVGTWPFFVSSVHAAVFGDVGQVWTRSFRSGDAKLSTGAELSSDLVLGYYFPLNVTVGAAWGRDGSGLASSGATVYFRVGRAF
jgi:WD40-like Beta Propeller Repeat